MKVIGLCKTFSCAEFMPAVMAGIYDELDAIVFVHSDRDWLGNFGQNHVKYFTDSYPDPFGKIESLSVSSSNQDEQYDIGINHILKTHPDADWIFLFDTDEVWGSDELRHLKGIAAGLVVENAVSCSMHTYIKSPFYRIAPPEPLKPCVMVRALPHLLRGVRGNRVRPVRVAGDVYFHHFSYVRERESDVFAKIKTSHAGDGVDYVDLDCWKSEKWDALPHATDFHTTCGCENYWKRVEVITEDDLPGAVLDLPVVRQFKERVEA